MDWGVEVASAGIKRGGPQGGVGFNLGVRDLKLSFGSGQSNRLPIMGPSGAGKSTFLNLLSCTSFSDDPDTRIAWSFPDGFSCEWGDAGPDKQTLLKLRQRYFGYAFQNASLQPHLTVRENLMLGLENIGHAPKDAYDLAVKGLRRVFANDEARVVGLLDRYESEVSGGERQRISLLQAFIRDPYVLFADEPTGSLDSETRANVMGVLLDWLAKKPAERALLWVTHHDNDPADNKSDTRVLVSNGAVSVQTFHKTKWINLTGLEGKKCP